LHISRLSVYIRSRSILLLHFCYTIIDLTVELFPVFYGSFDCKKIYKKKLNNDGLNNNNRGEGNIMAPFTFCIIIFVNKFR